MSNEENKKPNPKKNNPKPPNSIESLISKTSEKAIKNEIQKVVESALSKSKNIIQPKKKEINREVEKAAVKIQAFKYSGPIPPPIIFNGYKEVDPSFPERIMADYEKRSEHARAIDLQAMAIETQAINDEKINIRLGLAAAFIIALSFLGVGTYAAMNGRETFGSIVVGTTLAGIVGTFIYDRWGNKK